MPVIFGSQCSSRAMHLHQLGGRDFSALDQTGEVGGIELG
jgi:hypothetical protein